MKTAVESIGSRIRKMAVVLAAGGQYASNAVTSSRRQSIQPNVSQIQRIWQRNGEATRRRQELAAWRGTLSQGELVVADVSIALFNRLFSHLVTRAAAITWHFC